MNLIFLGPPGAGKGTMAVKLSKTRNLPHISTGELFRAAITKQTPLGKQVKAIVDSGKLVPDEVTVEMVKERFTRSDINDGYILDGFPRTTVQADALSDFSHVDAVINLVLKDDLIIRRLTGRRLCRSCGKGYHVESMPPKKSGICDACGGELYTRNDDAVDSIKNRLEVYGRQTQPLIDYYKERDLLVNVDASPAPDEVFKNLEKALADL